MKKLILFVFAVILWAAAPAQEFYQTVRGVISDQDSGIPLIGATVVVVGSDPIIGAVTDIDGNFRLPNVPIGRVTLQVTYIGYEDKTIPNLLITSAKEEILDIKIVEAVSKLEEVVINGNKAKGEVLNEMAISSAHTFSVEETSRYAGSFDDPARMVSAFAGVIGNPDGGNDIMVRGNSPKGILWRLEGIAIPNPNHFAGEGSTGGPINALSSKMLSNSDFFTGAFSAEYGDVTSGVFDMKLKRGNNEQREYTAMISTLGLDMTAEGPFSSTSKSSYLVNYRYSTLDLLDRAGIVDFGGVPRYQDVSFKINLPFNARHHVSFFGFGGRSAIESEDVDEENGDVVVGKFDGKYTLGVTGITHTFQINEAMYLRSSVAATGTDKVYGYDIPNNSSQFYSVMQRDISKTSLIASSAFNYKLNARNKVETGFILTRHGYKMNSTEWDFDTDQTVQELDDEGHSSTVQLFGNWKFRISDKLTMVNGLHFLQLTLNNNYSVEPRVAINWQVDEQQSFNAGFGLHSKLENMSIYLARQYDDVGNASQLNRDLELSKAAHFVAGYSRKVGMNTNIKVEAYYQHLYNVPVEDADTSAYSTLNFMEGYTTFPLVNEGTGRNYGVEFTAERYLHKGLYYMGTLSVFRSLYTPKDGIERSTTFDSNYAANLIGGKEFRIGNPTKNKVLFVNTKLVLIGGARYTPIDLEASKAKGNVVVDERNPFSVKGDDIFRADFSIGIRRNRKHTTTELKFDIQNILNNQTVIDEFYIHATQSIFQERQLGALPTISYKISF